ncbi:hypothetical protein R1flu_027222 [Riccia fluitans]|uniref:Translation elongation factor EF1B beta/delta subunit guanine nucleotide exchange domain-containing protein n=1 Tax=Riccia fluitans TaxID=41844 RepID=A0ABD1XI63_9MARC
MAVQFENLSGDAGLKQLDEYLLTRSYITGYQASRDDLSVYLAIEKAPTSKYVNAARWYSHITALLGSSFPGKAAGVKVAGSAVPSATREFVAPAAAPSTPEAAAEDAAGAPEAEEDDDDLDLFGEETEEEKAASAEREAQKKASGKKKESGKSSVLMDVKPWDDETDMKKLEEAVRSIQMEGLLWGASKLVPVGYVVTSSHSTRFKLKETFLAVRNHVKQKRVLRVPSRFLL